MLQKKPHHTADFGEILAAFERGAGEDGRAPARPGRPDAEAGAVTGPASKNRLRRLLGPVSLPSPFGIGGLISGGRINGFVYGLVNGFVNGLGARATAAYAAEAGQVPNQVPNQVPDQVPDQGPDAAPGPPASQVMEPETSKTEDQAIAEELGLSPGLAGADLQRIRRDFAKKNHPDRFEPARRLRAARRMSIANMLIDEYMRQSRLSR